MPDLIRLYIRQCLIGFALAAVFVVLLLAFNVANLWHLVSTSDIGLLAVFLLFIFNGIVFASVQFGIAIMGLAEPDDVDDPDRRGDPDLEFPERAVVPVVAQNGQTGKPRDV